MLFIYTLDTILYFSNNVTKGYIYYINKNDAKNVDNIIYLWIKIKIHYE